MESEATEKSPQSDVYTAVPEGPKDVQAPENPAPKASASGISGWAKNLKIPQAFGGSPNESPSENSGRSSSFSRLTSGFGLRLSPKASQQEENSEGASSTTVGGSPNESPSENSGRSSSFSRLTSGFGLRLSPKASQQEEKSEGASSTTVTSPQSGGFIGTITKGIVDSSKNAVKAVQVKARHAVSQNKRRYQEGGFDLDMTYITENIIAMGFPAGDLSSGFFGYVEGYYRNHMEEVIKYFETYHKDKYKVYNLCSERLYDVSLFDGKVASLPFDDHNCPPIQLITSFCQSAYSWLKEDIENVVVVHCKAGMARTGLMISSLLLYLKFFPTAEESIDYYNQKRCFDGKGLVLPSQIRYVKYFERVLTYFNGENQPGRRCMLRGFRLHRCPYWIRPSITVSDHNGVLFSTKKHPRTKDLSPEVLWFSAPKKGIMVFALPGEPGLTELAGDFKIHFHDRQGDFYCWLNTTMMENRKVLNTSDLDGFDKRKLPSPGFQVEVVLVDVDSASVPKSPTESGSENAAAETASQPSPAGEEAGKVGHTDKSHGSNDKDDVFSDSEMDETKAKGRQVSESSETARSTDVKIGGSDHDSSVDQSKHLTSATERLSLGGGASSVQSEPRKDSAKGPSPDVGASNTTGNISEFKAMAADASVFSFGDEDDYESD